MNSLRLCGERKIRLDQGLVEVAHQLLGALGAAEFG